MAMYVYSYVLYVWLCMSVYVCVLCMHIYTSLKQTSVESPPQPKFTLLFQVNKIPLPCSAPTAKLSAKGEVVHVDSLTQERNCGDCNCVVF